MPGHADAAECEKLISKFGEAAVIAAAITELSWSVQEARRAILEVDASCRGINSNLHEILQHFEARFPTEE